MITASDLPGVEEQTALRLIAIARSIAPCLDTLTNDYRESAVAILRGVAGEFVARGSGRIKSQRVGAAAVEYVDGSAFSDDDRAALRSICTSETAAAASGGPIGQFPLGGQVGRIWPEYYTSPPV